MVTFTAQQRKLIAVIAKYCISEFTEADWYSFGQYTGLSEKIATHPRLLRSLSFGDDDYEYHAGEMIEEACKENLGAIQDLIDQYDIDLWYQSKEPRKYERLFGGMALDQVEFWNERNCRVFFSHLASNRERVSRLAKACSEWGVETFVAHDDIEPSLEWLKEIEKALMTMDVLVAVVEQGFKESNWCDQEVGYALGRGVDIVPLRNGADPYGFMGKYQGLNVKGRYPEDLSNDIVRLIIKKKSGQKKVDNLPLALNRLDEETRVRKLLMMHEWKVLNKESGRHLLENTNLNDDSRSRLKGMIDSYEAVKPQSSAVGTDEPPF